VRPQDQETNGVAGPPDTIFTPAGVLAKGDMKTPVNFNV
jgi:hypothetical protein